MGSSGEDTARDRRAGGAVGAISPASTGASSPAPASTPDPAAPAAPAEPRLELRPCSPAVRALWAQQEALLNSLRTACVLAALTTDGLKAEDGWRFNMDFVRWEREVGP